MRNRQGLFILKIVNILNWLIFGGMGWSYINAIREKCSSSLGL